MKLCKCGNAKPPGKRKLCDDCRDASPWRNTHNANWRWYKYGITRDQYDEMVKAQNGVCAICHHTCHTGRSLAVDHGHETGRIRGLLCYHCNYRLLGYPLEVLKAAVEYLERGA